MDLGLSGKTVIVTGGGSNIGRAIVLTFAQEGANVVCAEIDEKIGQKTVKEANGLGGGGRTILIKTDATSPESIGAMVKKTIKEFGQIDALVNNVGGALPPAPFAKRPVEDLQKEVNMTFWTGVNCSRAVVPYMIKKKQGAIVNIGSAAGRLGTPQQPGYASAKGAVILFTKSLARELGQVGIRVNCVCPGLTPPKSTKEVGDNSCWTQWGLKMYGTEEMKKHFTHMYNLTRLGTAQDIAEMVVFLVSERASYVNGQTISVDGGESMM